MRSEKVAVIGVGFVGLNITKAFSESGYCVVAYDISEKRIKELSTSSQTNNVLFTSEVEDIEGCDLFMISVPTLLDSEGNPDHSYVEKAIDNIKPYLKRSNIVVLESSVSVGKTEQLLRHLISYGIHVGYSPERVDPGRTTPPFREIPKIISGLNYESLEAIRSFYTNVYKSCVTVSNSKTAEMCKLFENSFRLLNISYVNEIADRCKELDIDAEEMIHACSTKPYGFMGFMPGLGAGGHCIPVNPSFLMKGTDKLSLLNLANRINDERPSKKALEFIKIYKPIKVLILGIAYKPEETTYYKSPAYDFALTLSKNGVLTDYYDPYVTVEDDSDLKKIHLDDVNKELMDTYSKAVLCVRHTKADYTPFIKFFSDGKLLNVTDI